MILYRPVGPRELALILESQNRAFPPRLPDQPIFYPVLNFPYARQIAVEWNATSNLWAGYVTRFEVDDTYVTRFPMQIVGAAAIHQELWVPSEELETFNRHLQGPITLAGAYYGAPYQGRLGTTGLLDGLTVDEQADMLMELAADPTALKQLVAENMIAIALNWPHWSLRADGPPPVRDLWEAHSGRPLIEGDAEILRLP